MVKNLHLSLRAKEFLILTAIYALSHCWVLLNNGIFWDDWLWYDNYPELVKGMSELGLGLGGKILIMMYENPFGIWFSKIFVFASYLVSGFILKSILDLFNNLNNDLKFFTAAVFLTLPLNLARNSLCTANNGLNLMLFLLASLIALKKIVDKKTILTCGSLVLFFGSYFTNSLLPFMSIFYLAYSILFIQQKGLKNKKSFWELTQSLAPYFALPILFWITKKVFFKQYGLYSNYNKISFPDFMDLISAYALTLRSVFYEPFGFLFANYKFRIFHFVIAAGIAVIIFLIFNKVKRLKREISSAGSFYFLIFGLVAFVIGAFPYLLVGKIPYFNAWDSRHQILLSLGVAIIVTATLSLALVKDQSLFKVACSFLLVIFAAINIKAYAEFQSLYLKQVIIQIEMKTNPNFNKKIFLIEDTSHESFRFVPQNGYIEYTGMLYNVFKSADKFGSNNLSSIEEISRLPVAYRMRYKINNVENFTPQIKVTIHSVQKKSFSNTIKTTVLSWLDRNYLREHKEEILRFKYASF